jgi:hypothetical protein
MEVVMRRLGIIGVIAGVALSAPGFANNVYFAGRATGVSGTLASAALADNPMSCDGLPQNAALRDVEHTGALGLAAKKIDTYTAGRDNTSIASADVSSARLRLPELAIDADSIGSHAEVNCQFVKSRAYTSGQRTKYGVSGGATFGSLSINGQRTEISGEPNQTVTIPDVATIVINEQTRTPRSLVVAGLHVKMLDASLADGDVVVAYSRAKLICDP